jgi:hypothetical protein
MHCELVVPGLFACAAGARFPALELLLARGRGAGAPARPLEAWLGDAFGVAENPLPAGALSLQALGREPGEASWARADPVHLRLMRDRLILVPGEALSITHAEALALCDALNRHFAPLELLPLDEARWCAKVDFAVAAETPLELAGRELGAAVPAGMSRIVNEMQMLLHAHPANEAREATGEPAVNSVWFWGGGRAPRVPACRWHSVTSADPVARGLASAAGSLRRTPAATAAAWLERAPEDGRHLVVLDALRVPLALGDATACRALAEALERDWFAPLLEALRAGRIGMVTLHVPEAGAAFETARADLRRFWRRPRAVARYA